MRHRARLAHAVVSGEVRSAPGDPPAGGSVRRFGGEDAQCVIRTWYMRAERAAIALERAWGRWRVMHGLGTDPPPPVSSYVGYSLEEPWGQPESSSASVPRRPSRLAALLDGHDCVGPVHAEVVASPAAGSRVHVPAQAPADGARPGAPEYLTAKQALPPRSAAPGEARRARSGRPG